MLDGATIQNLWTDYKFRKLATIKLSSLRRWDWANVKINKIPR